MKSTFRPTVLCPGRPDMTSACGSRDYVATWNDDGRRVWECTNCHHQTARKIVRRKTNGEKAIDAFRTVKAEWFATDQTLKTMVERGEALPGALIVHGSSLNYHIHKLLDGRLSTWELRYHTEAARTDLAAAKRFVIEHQKGN